MAACKRCLKLTIPVADKPHMKSDEPVTDRSVLRGSQRTGAWSLYNSAAALFPCARACFTRVGTYSAVEPDRASTMHKYNAKARHAMCVKIDNLPTGRRISRTVVVVAVVAPLPILGAGCGSTTDNGGSARTGSPSVAQIQAFVNEKLNPHVKIPTPTAALPPGATDMERALAKAKEFNRYPNLIHHTNSQTTCVDEGQGKFKCLTTYSVGWRENQLTNATCSRDTSLSCIIETTKAGASEDENNSAGDEKTEAEPGDKSEGEAHE